VFLRRNYRGGKVFTRPSFNKYYVGAGCLFRFVVFFRLLLHGYVLFLSLSSPNETTTTRLPLADSTQHINSQSQSSASYSQGRISYAGILNTRELLPGRRGRQPDPGIFYLGCSRRWDSRRGSSRKPENVWGAVGSRAEAISIEAQSLLSS